MRMGAVLSRMVPMELRREEGARAEPYNMLLETEAALRAQRALKRELYFTRAALFVLVLVLVLVLGLGFCMMFYMQFPACKDKGYDGRANGDQEHQLARSQHAAQDSDLKQPRLAFQNGNQDHQQDDVSKQPKQPFSASLKAACSTNSARGNGNITWEEKRELVGFTLQENKSLVVPELGTYRISLQIIYRSTGNVAKEIKLYHKVVVYQKGYKNKPKTVLEVFDFIYWKDFMWFKTTYSEDDTILDSGDIIRVESTNLSLIRCAGSFLSVRRVPTG